MSCRKVVLLLLRQLGIHQTCRLRDLRWCCYRKELEVVRLNSYRLFGLRIESRNLVLRAQLCYKFEFY